MDAASNVMFDLVSTWVDDVTDQTKKTQAWCLFLKYIIQGLNKTPASVSDLSNVYQIQIENNNLYTLGDDFGETIADPSQNNRTVAESIATYSNYRGTLRLLCISDAKNPTGKRVRSITITGSFLKVLNLSPTEPYTFQPNETILDVNFGRMNHNYIYLRCAQSKKSLTSGLV